MRTDIGWLVAAVVLAFCLGIIVGGYLQVAWESRQAAARQARAGQRAEGE